MIDEPKDQASRSLEDYWAMLRARRWWILVPVFICWSLVWGVSWLLPATYQSDALILVEQQKVPEHYVVPNVTIGLQDRLQSMTQQILSRTRLQATIDRFHLFQPHTSLMGLIQSLDPVEQMRANIKIELVQAPGHPDELRAFKIQYSAGSPELAQQVNSELTTLFIDENLKSQQQLSENTTAFLDNQLSDARAKLAEQETKIRAFKAQHLGELPTQLAGNVQVLSALQTQLQGTQQALEGAQQQKLYLESLLQQYRAARASLGRGESEVTPPQAMEKELKDLRLRLADERSKHTGSYPDVVALKDQIAKTEKLKKQIEDELASKQNSSKTTSASGPDAVAEAEQPAPTPAMMQIESQLKASQFEIQNLQQRQRDVESRIAEYQGRLNVTPKTEQELIDISRGYEESQANYNSLLQKQMQSQLATSLEQRQQGEQFHIIDPPSLANKPSAPNHFVASLTGLVLGIAVGLGLAALLELRDVRVRREKDLEGLVPARVLVGIPRLSTPAQERRRTTVRWMERSAAAAMVISMVVGNIYAFYKG